VAYYQGDYYQGDYYQGDPFLGALIAKGVSWLGKKIFKRKLSEPGQAMLSQRVTAGTRKYGGIGAAGIVATGATLPIPFSPFQVTPQAFLPGGAPLFSRRNVPPGAMAPAGGPGMMGCPSGYHLNKSRSCDGRPAGSYLVRNRSMNVANPRALRRSLRRVAGFGKLAQRSKKDIRRAAKAIGA